MVSDDGIRKKVGEFFIDEDGWIDYTVGARHTKPIIESDFGNSTKIVVPQIRTLFEKFLELDREYLFTGVKLHPEVEAQVSSYKKTSDGIKKFNPRKDRNEDRIFASDELVRMYTQVLSQSLTEQGIPHIQYSLLEKERDAYIPGKFSWPKIFVIPSAQEKNFVTQVKELQYKREEMDAIDGPQFYRKNELDCMDDVGGLEPLVVENDVHLRMMGRDIQAVINFMHPHQGTYYSSTLMDCFDDD